MKYFTLLLFLIYSTSNAQPYYQRAWGTVVPLFNKPVQAFSPKKNIKSTPFVSQVNERTGHLYTVTPEGDEIIVYTPESPVAVSFFKMKSDTPNYIENIKFDSHSNMVVTGRTFNDGLATAGAYMDKRFLNSYTGDWFLAKIDPSGTVVWCTYFHEIIQNTAHLTVDEHDNIYLISKRSRSEDLGSSAFQRTGDPDSFMVYQDVLTKLSPDGKHLWSTFYANDQSKLLAIEADSDGVYVYGSHLTKAASSSYFGTPDAFQQTVTGTNRNTSAVFISKFGSDGQRLWSTYFGYQKTTMPVSSFTISKNRSPITVIGNEVYFIVQHAVYDGPQINWSTQGAYLTNIDFTKPYKTLSCFSDKGARKWTTYIEAGDMIEKAAGGKQLFLAAGIDSDKETLIRTTKKAFQSMKGGGYDVFTYILTTDGVKRPYATWYGYGGYDAGFTLPAVNGYYTIGFSQLNDKPETSFAAKKAPLKEFTQLQEGNYGGNFIGYFVLKR